MSTHSLSVVHPNATIGAGVEIGPFSYVEDDVVIGEGCHLGPNVTIYAGTRLGKNVRIFPGAVVGGVPQDLKYAGEYTTTQIGDNTTIRECVTVNRGTAAAGETIVGKNCLLMAYAHVAHDCILGDNIVIANNVNLAGHVVLEDFVIIEGQVGVQQFVRIGQHSFIAGGSLVRKSVPPYIRAAREPLSYIGVNRIGLQRRNFAIDQINRIHEIYRILFVRGLNLTNAITEIEASVPVCNERDDVIKFIAETEKTGIIRSFNSLND
ncbi:acyl-ACP--UDP-N-acetylglucosamine O-acyltransferase [Neolewinella antarctica]|uniref:UDP-N-acetylglucosamine acyltransferase n=1 Tax=Neolewinella antarctica TaxID=442734 RepID=A0ABX0X608_9BACT|nr:acyl-ACP--UDP-N-acetylglucosamine O-acyltransferase [Neolewinella antarctica]NJC24630.1 UDP-N-acetylglucosamine acyltransferase [Neolewinella antarctica]